jgi:Uma2 family endonuclease
MSTQTQDALPLHRLDVETYNRIVASGALEGRRVELLDGALVEMSPQSPAHATVVRHLMRHFASEPKLWIDAQLPLEVRPNSEPEPDLAVRDHEPPPGEHPRSALLVIEVAVTSQLIDRNVKAAKYAAANIPTYWLIDVPGRAVEVRTNPGPDGYTHCETYAPPASVPSPLPGIADLDIAALLTGVTG